jgi:alcohol dehydrogenase class IV
MVAEQAMIGLFRSLPAAFEKPDQILHREETSWCSLLAGLAIASAGTTVAHALAQPLGAHAHLPHSVTVGLFTLPVLRRTWRSEPDRFARLSDLIEPKLDTGSSVEEKASRLPSLIETFLRRVGFAGSELRTQIPDSIREALITDVTGYMSRPLAQHPKAFSEQDLRDIVSEALGTGPGR